MASSKRNSSSHTSHRSRSSQSPKKDSRNFTSPLSALPLLKEQEKEDKEREKDREKEKDKKGHHHSHSHHHHHRHHDTESISVIDQNLHLVVRKDSPLKKISREKRPPSPVRLAQASSSKATRLKSPSPIRESGKQICKRAVNVIKEELRPLSKKEKNKKDVGLKQKQSNMCNKPQKIINECLKTPIKLIKDDNGKKTTLAVEKNEMNSLNKPQVDHNISNASQNNEEKKSTEEKKANEGKITTNESQSNNNAKEKEKEKEETKNKKLSPDMQSKLHIHISKTIQQRKIFAMGCSNFGTIRNAMLKRGWIQKYGCEEPSLKTGSPPGDPEGLYTHRMLRMIPIYFIWVYTVQDWNDIKPQTLVNRFPRASALHSITTKIGLNYNLQQSHWFFESGVAGVKYPRTYSILSQEDLYDFVDDYIMTACTSLLKLIVRSVIRVEHDLLRDGEVNHKTIDFALNRCNDYVAFREHKDIDSIRIPPTAQQTAKEFLKNFYKIVHDGATFETAPHNEVQSTYLAAKAALHGIQRFRPQTNLDGYKNLWLLKQSNLNCGKGVQILNTLEEIVDAVGEIKNPRYVIQKYIERPLLIYDTKFDIRQWVLLTSINPLQIWMYKECYLRFSSQVFSLCDISESVHLCNNVIQRRYKNGKRHPNLPAENMWDNTTFQKYLVDIGEPDKWDSVIYPGMKECVIATVMAAQEDMVERVNSFELYGVDFMLTEDFRPWLIEVNASPAMGPTTSVTSRMCSQCLNDVIKVVVDRRSNPKAETGQFTLIYKQEVSALPKSMPSDFAIIGKKISLFTKPSNKYLSSQRSPPVLDLTKTNTGRDFCIKDSPSTCVMSILMQKKSWISDSRIKNNKKRKDSKSDATPKIIEVKDIKPVGEKQCSGKSPTAEFIKSTILSDLIHKTCLLTSYDEAHKVTGKEPEILNNKKNLKESTKNSESKNNESKNNVKDKNNDPLKNTNMVKNNVIRSNNNVKNINTTNAGKNNNNTVKNNDKTNTAKNTNKGKPVTNVKNSNEANNSNEENTKIAQEINEALLNNIYIIKNNDIRVINEVNNNTLNSIYIIKDNNNNAGYNNVNSVVRMNDDIKSSNEVNNMYQSKNELQIAYEEHKKDIEHSVNNDISIIYNKNKEEGDICKTDVNEIKYFDAEEEDGAKKDGELKNNDKEKDKSIKKGNYSTVVKDQEQQTRGLDERQSFFSCNSSTRSAESLHRSETKTSNEKETKYNRKKEENLNKILQESMNIKKFPQASLKEEDESEEKAIQYTIYYNKDRTHFIVDVVESNTKKNKQKDL